MKDPVIIDAAELRDKVEKCKKWIEDFGNKEPFQKRDTKIFIATVEEILGKSKPLPAE